MSEFPFFGKKSKTDEVLDQCCPKLSYKQRMIGFIVCSIIGWVLSCFALAAFLKGSGGIATFAVLYTIGNIVCIIGTCFLAGPKSQVKKMKEPSRIVTTVIFILAMIGTLIFALVIEEKLVCLLFIIIQFGAYIWYTLSFIPFGQKIAKKICCQCCDEESSSSK